MRSARDPMIPAAPTPRVTSRSSSRGNRALVPLTAGTGGILPPTSSLYVGEGPTPTPPGGLGQSWTSKTPTVATTHHQDQVSMHSLTNWPSFTGAGKGLDRPATVQTDLTTGTQIMGSPRRQGARARPPLVLELDAFVRRELFAMQQALHREPNIWERLPTFGEVWGTLISHFSEYAELLSGIKKEYDEALKEGMAAVNELHRLRSDAKSAKEFYAYMLDGEKGKHEASLLGLQNELKVAKEEIEKLRTKEKKWIELDHKTHVEISTIKQDRGDLAERCKTLSDAQRNEAVRQGVLVRQGKKLQTDNDRLQNLCKEMEIKIKNDQVLLVSAQALPGIGGFEHNTGASRTGKVPSKSPMAQSGASLRRPSFMEVANQAMKKSTNVPLHTEGSMGHFGEDDVEEALEARGKVKRLMRIVARLNQTVSSQAERIKMLAEKRSGRPDSPRPNWGSLVRVVPELDWPKDEERSSEYLERACAHIQDRFSERRYMIDQKAQTATVREWFADANLCESDLLYAGRKTFIGLGTGPHVPVYQRYHGGVRNLQIPKGDVEGFLKKFWDHRTDRIRVEGSNVKELDDFFLEWLRGEAKKPIELAYTILDVCERYRSDPDCGMFLSILQGRVSEATLVDQLSVVERLQSVLQSNDRSKTGSLPRRLFHDLLRKFFPAKAKSDMLKLRFALIPFTKELFDKNDPAVSRGPFINYQQAFEEDDDGNQTRFIELIRAQHLEEVTEYVVDVEETLRDVVVSGKLSVGPAKTAIKVLDPQVPGEELNNIIAHGAHVTVEQLDSLGEHYQVNAEDFLKRIRMGVLLKRYSKKPGFEEEDDDDEDEEIDALEEQSNARTGVSMANISRKSTTSASFTQGLLGQSSATHDLEEDGDDVASSVSNNSEEDAIDFTEMDEQLMGEADQKFGRGGSPPTFGVPNIGLMGSSGSANNPHLFSASGVASHLSPDPPNHSASVASSGAHLAVSGAQLAGSAKLAGSASQLAGSVAGSVAGSAGSATQLAGSGTQLASSGTQLAGSATQLASSGTTDGSTAKETSTPLIASTKE